MVSLVPCSDPGLWPKYPALGLSGAMARLGLFQSGFLSSLSVPPGLDPLQLDIGARDSWFERQPPLRHRIKWFPGNFTNERGELVGSLRLALWGYKERKDDRDKKFVPILEKIGILSTSVPNVRVPGRSEAVYELQAQTPQWVNEGERNFLTYRFGFLRLYEEDSRQPNGEGGGYVRR